MGFSAEQLPYLMYLHSEFDESSDIVHWSKTDSVLQDWPCREIEDIDKSEFISKIFEGYGGGLGSIIFWILDLRALADGPIESVLLVGWLVS